MENDPIKRSLDEIEQELEAALANLNATNQRVDELLNEYGTEPAPNRPASNDLTEASPDPGDGSDEPPPEY